MRILNISAAVGAALFLSACTMSPQECDPSLDPGFLDKIGCTISGSYAQRVEDKEADLKALQQENERLHKIASLLENDRALVEGSLETRRQQYQALSAQISALKSDLSAKQQLSSSLNAQLDNMQQQADELQQMPENSALLERRQKLAELQETAAALGIL